MTFVKPWRHENRHCSNLLAYSVIIVIDGKINQKKYGMKRANMSMVMNEGVNICCKSVTTQVYTVIGLLVELVTYIAKAKGYIEE